MHTKAIAIDAAQILPLTVGILRDSDYQVMGTSAAIFKDTIYS